MPSKSFTKDIIVMICSPLDERRRYLTGVVGSVAYEVLVIHLNCNIFMHINQ